MSSSRSDQMAQDFAGFIQAFGVLRSDTTPCGQPMSVSTAHALCELAARPPLNQRDLAGRLGLTTSTVSRLVDQLQRRGWAERVVDPESSDSRVRLIVLTADGDDAAQQVLQARTLRFTRLLEAVPREKQADVLEALTLLKVAANALH